MAKSPFRTALLCEHIVIGQGNKHTLVGVYSGDIVVTTFPANLRMAFFSEFIPPSNGKHTLGFVIRLDDKTVVELNGSVNDTKKGIPVAVSLPAFNVNVTAETPIIVDVTFANSQKTNLITKKIIHAVVPAGAVT